MCLGRPKTPKLPKLKPIQLPPTPPPPEPVPEVLRPAERDELLANRGKRKKRHGTRRFRIDLNIPTRPGSNGLNVT
jgi:U5 snRNP spliceosome subunit